MDQTEFDEACKNYRIAKLQAKKAEKEMKKYYSDIRAYASDNELKGEILGLKFTPAYSFVLDANIEEATKLGWSLPEDHSLTISNTFENKTKEELIKIAKDNGLEADAVQTTVDKKKLENMFKKKKVSATYSVSMRIGLSAVE